MRCFVMTSVVVNHHHFSNMHAVMVVEKLQLICHAIEYTTNSQYINWAGKKKWFNAKFSYTNFKVKEILYVQGEKKVNL